MAVAVLILAAGRGERLGAAEPKAFVELAGRPLLSRSIVAIAAAESVDFVLPVIGAGDRTRFEALGLSSEPKLLPPVPGGKERQDSMAEGLAALPAEVEWVGVHDAARCLVEPADVDRVVEAARRFGAALLAEPARDTIKRVRDGVVVETPPRAECWAAQTPQVFRRDWLADALQKAREQGVQGTDDAQLVESLGHAVHVVEGSPTNLKITLPGDLVRAEAWLSERRR